MATRYGRIYTGVRDGTKPAARADSSAVDGKVRRLLEVYDLASQPVADKLFAGTLPLGARFAGSRLTTDTTLASATLALGSSASAAKYAAAAVLTATDTPTTRGKVSALDDDPLSAPEDLFWTIAADALPAAGILVSEVFYTVTA